MFTVSLFRSARVLRIVAIVVVALSAAWVFGTIAHPNPGLFATANGLVVVTSYVGIFVACALGGNLARERTLFTVGASRLQSALVQALVAVGIDFATIAAADLLTIAAMRGALELVGYHDLLGYDSTILRAVYLGYGAAILGYGIVSFATVAFRAKNLVWASIPMFLVFGLLEGVSFGYPSFTEVVHAVNVMNPLNYNNSTEATYYFGRAMLTMCSIALVCIGVAIALFTRQRADAWESLPRI